MSQHVRIPARSGIVKWFLILATALPIALGGLTAHGSASEPECKLDALDGRPATELTQATGEPVEFSSLAQAQVIYIGEIHDRFDHHLNQLDILCRLHRLASANGQAIVVGIEYVEYRFQQALDAYIAQRIGFDQLLVDTEYFDRWGFDPKLYEPIFEFARTHRIPIVALNIEREIIRAIASEGIDRLNDADRAKLALPHGEVGASYKAALESVFQQHPTAAGGNFENFLDAQLSRDEFMAARIEATITRSAKAQMLVLAGAMHVALEGSVPDRARRRGVQNYKVIAPKGIGIEAAPGTWLAAGRPAELRPPGRIGIMVEPSSSPPRISEVAPDSAAHEAGLSQGDRILAINGVKLDRFSELRQELWRTVAGDQIELTIGRNQAEHTTSITLR